MRQKILLLLAVLLPAIAFGETIKNETLTDTYWRNVTTGDWLVGFAKSHIVLDSKVWDITSKSAKDDEYSFTITYGKETKKVIVEKLTDGKRNISIDGHKGVACSKIVTDGLPDYPVKDLRDNFVDNGYNDKDSVEITGWLKDMRMDDKNKVYSFKVLYSDIFFTRMSMRQAMVDSIGRFRIKIPMINSSEVMFDWNYGERVITVLEPGKKYFFLHDFTTGQELFMGDDVRVQNELVSYPWKSTMMQASAETYHSGIMDYISSLDKEWKADSTRMDSFFTAHPNFSKRCMTFVKGTLDAYRGICLGQSRFVFRSSQELIDFIDKEVWQKMAQPLTLSGNVSFFLCDWMEMLLEQRHGIRSPDFTADAILLLEKKGVIKLDDDERQLVCDYSQRLKENDKAVEAVPLNGESAMDEVVSTDSALNVAVHRLKFVTSDIGKKVLKDAEDEAEQNLLLATINAVTNDPAVHDIIIARYLLHRFNWKSEPLDSSMTAFANKEIRLELARDALKKANDQRAELYSLDSSASPKPLPTSTVDGIDNGKAIIEKLAEHYRGRPVLVCVWGWEPSYKATAFVDSKAEYEKLKPYNVKYIFIDDQDLTKGKACRLDYSILGDDMAYYKLPSKVVTRIMQFVGPRHQGEYCLVGVDGKVRSEDVDTEDLDFLEDVLKRIVEK